MVQSTDTFAVPCNRLAGAYQNALYRIDTVPALTLRIGQTHPDLLSLQHSYGCKSSLILTACNPRSRRVRPAANERRMRALRRALDALGYRYLPAIGLDQQGRWPDEASLWVPGLPLAQGLALARRFRQNALVWCTESDPVQLIWTAAGKSP